MSLSASVIDFVFSLNVKIGDYLYKIEGFRFHHVFRKQYVKNHRQLYWDVLPIRALQDLRPVTDLSTDVFPLTSPSPESLEHLSLLRTNLLLLCFVSVSDIL